MYLAKYDGREWSYWFTDHPDDDAEVLVLVEDIQNRERYMIIAFWDAFRLQWSFVDDDLRVLAWKRLPDMPEL